MTNRKTCRRCERPRTEGEKFTHRGYCPTCSEAAYIEPTLQMVAHAGPAFDRWREAMARSVGATPPGG